MAKIKWCSGCGGSGIVDEEAAERMGIELGDARVQVCPLCEGSGEEERIDSWWPVVLVFAAIATAAFVIGMLFEASVDGVLR